jgi:hypothetical protein
VEAPSERRKSRIARLFIAVELVQEAAIALYAAGSVEAGGGRAGAGGCGRVAAGLASALDSAQVAEDDEWVEPYGSRKHGV